MSEALGELRELRMRQRREERRKDSGVNVGDDNEINQSASNHHQGSPGDSSHGKVERGVNRWIYIWGELAITNQLMDRLEEAKETWEQIVEIARGVITDRGRYD